MALTVVLASDVMDSSAALLNDTARALYTNAVQQPYLRMANESLEQVLLSYGIDVQRKNSSAIDVAALAATLILPSDFLLPISLHERADGSISEADWTPMYEQDSLIGFIQTNTLGVWSYNNNAVNFIGATTAREVLLTYERSLADVSTAASPIDVEKFKRFLSRKTAELCARFIGMNSTLADELLLREVIPAENDLVSILVKNMQGVRHRRGSFASGRTLGAIIR